MAAAHLEPLLINHRGSVGANSFAKGQYIRRICIGGQADTNKNAGTWFRRFHGLDQRPSITVCKRA